MNYYNKETNFIQSTPAPGLLEFPDEFMSIFYPSDKRAAGFVTIEDDGQRVTSCVWDEAAYQEWCESNSILPEPEPEPPAPTLDERVTALETEKASQADVDELNEALNMILTGYTGEEGTDEAGA